MRRPWVDETWLPGVLSKSQMITLAQMGYIKNVDLSPESDVVDMSSMDLHITNEVWEMTQGSIKPSINDYESSVLNDTKYASKLDDQGKGFYLLESSKCYVFKLKERINNGPFFGHVFYGKATAKSSIGRLDVIARTIVDNMNKYEYWSSQQEEQSGELFLEIIPISFNILVAPGCSLTQIRFFYGSPEESEIKNSDLIKNILLDGDDNADGHLSVNVTNTTIGSLKVAAFRAFSDKSREGDQEDHTVDLRKKEATDPCAFWHFDLATESGGMVLKKNNFYLLRSKEKIALPGSVAVYARAMDESLGEMRIHYAGFAHPYFGWERKDKTKGTPLIFEVRAHNVDVFLQDGESLADLVFYRMSREDPPAKRRPYGDQDLTLSNFFMEWPEQLIYDEETCRVSEQ